ncbi:inositol monophosphatase [Candidatus Woesearchaeota archaeon]|nr:MAG: inositol monophosphatase [Candidatus Woesearchaeota archaeon]
MQENTSEYLDLALTLTQKSSRLLLRMQPHAKINVEKGQGDFALDADIASEKLIVSGIRKKYPAHDILTEESKHQHTDSEYLWIIDPLEGTLNYAHKLPLWAVNIGLWKGGKPLLGVVYAPLLNELYTAVSGKGAFLNGKPIRVNTDRDLLHTFVAGSVKHLASLNLSGHVLRSIGCCALELCWVARGMLGARVKLHGSDPYGYGPTACIISEAGGKLTDPHGKPWKLRSNGAVASNGKLHKKLIALCGNTS